MSFWGVVPYIMASRKWHGNEGESSREKGKKKTDPSLFGSLTESEGGGGGWWVSSKVRWRPLEEGKES